MSAPPRLYQKACECSIRYHSKESRYGAVKIVKQRSIFETYPSECDWTVSICQAKLRSFCIRLCDALVSGRLYLRFSRRSNIGEVRSIPDGRSSLFVPFLLISSSFLWYIVSSYFAFDGRIGVHSSFYDHVCYARYSTDSHRWFSSVVKSDRHAIADFLNFIQLISRRCLLVRDPRDSGLKNRLMKVRWGFFVDIANPDSSMPWSFGHLPWIPWPGLHRHYCRITQYHGVLSFLYRNSSQRVSAKVVKSHASNDTKRAAPMGTRWLDLKTRWTPCHLFYAHSFQSTVLTDEIRDKLQYAWNIIP
jgi:hypothetical protein